jgi:hypothetical protein
MRDIQSLGGRVLTLDEVRLVEAATGQTVPVSLAALLTSRPLVGLDLRLEEDADESGLGAEFRWMTAEQMIDEATNAYPGIAAVRCGLLPVGICLVGSGDPYFLRLTDGAIVRVPHDAVVDDDIDTDQVERVAASIESLIDTAEITGDRSVSG